MNTPNRFKKFGGVQIPNIVEYLKDYINVEPNVTISVGCDSIQKRHKTTYCITIMLYDVGLHHGAHVVFFRTSVPKIKNTFERLRKESDYALELAEYLHTELSEFYTRKDLNILERKRYKYHLLKSEGKYDHVLQHHEGNVIENLSLVNDEVDFEFKLVDIHLDFNPFEGLNGKNKSHTSYRSFVPWLRGMGYRVFAKNLSFASTSAADLLLKD